MANGVIETLAWAVEQIPAWLRGLRASAWQSGMWLTTEAVVRGARAAVRARYPRKTSTTALADIAAERRIERGMSETTSSFAARLARAHTTKRGVGTSAGVQRELRACGFPTATVYEAKDWFPGIAPWARFWVVIKDPTLVSTTFRLGDGTVLGSGVRIGGVDRGARDLIRRVIQQTKAPHTKCVHVKIVVDATVLGTGWTLGSGVKLGGRSVTFTP